jgi:hypothetical protein
MIELTAKDIKYIDTFVPQTTVEKINDSIRMKAREECRAKGHIPELYKKGHIIPGLDTAQFEELQWGHRCRFCNTKLNPIAYEEIA